MPKTNMLINGICRITYRIQSEAKSQTMLSDVLWNTVLCGRNNDIFWLMFFVK